MSFSFLSILLNLIHFNEVNIGLNERQLQLITKILDYSPIAEDLVETWIIGILSGLIIAFLLLSILSKIRPYTLSGFWFVALFALYLWRSGFVFLVIPSLSKSPYSDIYIFILGYIPFIIFLIINKVISVMQAKEHLVFARVFTISIWACSGYLMLITITTIISPEIVISNLQLIQILFWLILGVEGLLLLFWLIFSSKKSYKFIQFQSSFGLLFLVSVVGKVYMNFTNSSSGYLKPKYLLWGIAAQIVFIYWLLLKEIFKNWDADGSSSQTHLEFKIDPAPAKDVKPNPKEEKQVLKDLSSREMEILLAYCNGFSYRDISNSFFISPNTVKTHLKNCYLKLDINSKVEAISIVNEFNQAKSLSYDNS